MDLFNLTGKVALVTGASKGLGEAMALGLSKAGARVALCARNQEDLNRVQKKIEEKGGVALVAGADILQAKSIREMVGRVLDHFGQIDILVNNAGIILRKPLLDWSEEEWDRVLDTNLKGYFLVSQAVVPQMITRRKGKIINMASIFGTVALTNQVGYASSKGGVIQMTKVMALEWAPYHVNVNAIAPAYFESARLVSALQNDPERHRFIVDRTPMKRLGRPEELEGITIFLASQASDFITGQTIFIDGGWTIW
jgi:gluconate 5-dehydrogenase